MKLFKRTKIGACLFYAGARWYISTALPDRVGDPIQAPNLLKPV